MQLFDLWSPVYGYPLEDVVEAMAPTTEPDLQQLPVEKQRVYRAIQASHIHGSPDGPWFFIIARNDVKAGELQLIGVTDTSMPGYKAGVLSSMERACRWQGLWLPFPRALITRS